MDALYLFEDLGINSQGGNIRQGAFGVAIKLWVRAGDCLKV